MRGCYPYSNPNKWFDAAISGDLQYIIYQDKLYAGYRDRRENSAKIITGMAAIHYAVINNQAAVFVKLYELEYLTITKVTQDVQLSTSTVFSLGRDSSIVHLAIVYKRPELMKYILQRMQYSDDKELISLQNNYGQTASMLGAIIGGEAAKEWFSSPLVALIESFIADHEGTTLPMAAGLYKRPFVFKQLIKIFESGEVSYVYKNRLCKLMGTKTVEGWSVDDAVTDGLDFKKHGITFEDSELCSKLLYQVFRCIKRQQSETNLATQKKLAASATTPSAITNIKVFAENGSSLAREQTLAAAY